MAEEDLVSYKDISELKKELEGMKDKKDVSTKDLYDVVQKLADTISGMLEVFGAAAEQLGMEEKGYESEAKKYEIIISKLDKLLDQNKTIAEGMVAIVGMVKENLGSAEKQGTMFKPKANEEPLFRQKRFIRPQTAWQPSQESAPMPQPMSMPTPQPIAQPTMLTPTLAPPAMSQPLNPPDFGMQMPPMEPTPSPDLDFPEEPFPLGEEPKRKGLFGMFKK